MRAFNLNIEDFKSKEEKAFYKAALKAYLKGARTFRFRYTNDINGRIPAYFNTPITNKEKL